jgi:hypothetical protein
MPKKKASFSRDLLQSSPELAQALGMPGGPSSGSRSKCGTTG